MHFTRTSIAAFLLAAALSAAPQIDEQTMTQVNALSRLKHLDVEANAPVRAAILKVLEKTRGTAHFVEIVRDFKLKGQGEALLEYATQHPDESSAIEAFRLAVAELGSDALQPLLAGDRGPTVARLIARSNEKALRSILRDIVHDTAASPALREEAVRGLAQAEDGARFLLELARGGKLAPGLELVARAELQRAPWSTIREDALSLLPLSVTNHSGALPPVSELIKRKGDSRRGKAIFANAAAACSSCHQVHGQGTAIGPDLSEIGTKLGKEALYEAILDPSAGISFGFEAWLVELKDGDEAFGIITSETDDEITLKNQTGTLMSYPNEAIARRQKMATSMMPAGLHLSMSIDDLADLVEYLSTLRKP